MSKMKFYILSLFGVFVFFVPIYAKKVPIIILVDIIKESFSNFKEWFVIVVLLISVIYFGLVIFLNKSGKKKLNIFFIISLISFGMMNILKFNVFLGDIREEIFNLIYGIIITTFITGFGVIFILKSGLVEFIAILVEPIMKKVFRLPGHSAVDCLSSFVSSPTVGIFVTNRFYEENKYTEREACSIAVNFSMVSIGFMATLCSMANIDYLYNMVILTSFLISLLLAFITIRIPPLSKKRELYANGSGLLINIQKKIKFNERFLVALEIGRLTSKRFTIKSCTNHILETVRFIARMVVLIVVPLVVMLYISINTSIIEVLSIPIIPFLKILKISDASIVAPATMLGIVEVALPVMYVSNFNISDPSAFIVVVLSIVQIIFFTETGIIILTSSIPLKIRELIFIFFIRTAIAIPILAVISKLIIR